MIDNLLAWAEAVGNWRFAEQLKQYVKIIQKPDFKEILTRRRKQNENKEN